MKQAGLALAEIEVDGLLTLRRDEMTRTAGEIDANGLRPIEAALLCWRGIDGAVPRRSL